MAEQTLINDVFPVMLPAFFAELGIPTDHVIDLFDAFGGHALSTPVSAASSVGLAVPW
jgi:hypothetical protein